MTTYVRRGTPEWERLRRELASGEKPKGKPRCESKGSGGKKVDHADDALIILERAGITGFRREVRFHPTRRWRFDLAVVREDGTIPLAVEIEGMNRFAKHPGEHRSVEGYAKNLCKYNEAAIMGITVVRFVTEQMNDGTMVDIVRRAMERIGL